MPLKHSLRILRVAWILMLAAATSAFAADELHWLSDYDGTISGRYRVRMTLSFNGEEIDGVYFYATQLKDIHLKGHLTEGNIIVLDELDDTGKAVARFEGRFQEHDSQGHVAGKLEREVITGFWRKLDSSEKLPLYLSMTDGVYGSLANRYASSGCKDDALIHRMAFRFWHAVKTGDKKSVAALISYPICVRISGRPATVANPAELVSSYDAIFSPNYRRDIANAPPRNMFARHEGIMLGNGDVWFDANGKVIALNND